MGRRVTRARVVVIALAVLAVVAAQLTLPRLAQSAKAADPADPGSITLHVQSARSVNTGPGFVHEGDAVTTYKWLINAEDIGNPKDAPSTACRRWRADPNFADTCQWPSVRTTPGYRADHRPGRRDDAERHRALTGPAGRQVPDLGDGRRVQDRRCALHRDLRLDADTVVVQMQPLPLPLQTIRLQVFNDNAPVDGTYEVDAEQGLAGFTANLTDVLGPVSTDYYGNPLCTVYLHAGGNPTRPILFTAAGKPRVDDHEVDRALRQRRRRRDRDPEPRARTATRQRSRRPSGQGWVQTTTLEGGHDHDIWQQEGETGFDTEQTKGAELVPYVHFGFTKQMALPAPAAGQPLPSGEIKGVAVAALPYVGGQNGQVVPETGFAGAKIGGPIRRPWVALSDLDAGDAEVYLGRGNVDGSFDIQNVPDGSYSADASGTTTRTTSCGPSRSRCTAARPSTSATSRSSAGSPTSTARSSSTTTRTASATPVSRACRRSR